MHHRGGDMVCYSVGQIFKPIFICELEQKNLGDFVKREPKPIAVWIMSSEEKDLRNKIFSMLFDAIANTTVDKKGYLL